MVITIAMRKIAPQWLVQAGDLDSSDKSLRHSDGILIERNCDISLENTLSV
jgi:hypothetical protein